MDGISSFKRCLQTCSGIFFYFVFFFSSNFPIIPFIEFYLHFMFFPLVFPTHIYIIFFLLCCEFQLHIEFRPESFNGIIMLTGERDDLTGDFMALLIHQGFIEFW